MDNNKQNDLSVLGTMLTISTFLIILKTLMNLI